MIQYQFALDNMGDCIDINTISPDQRKARAPFICLSCNKELIAKLGKIKRKHFAHKYEATCNRETYLHKLAKYLFVSTFKEALSNSKPVFLHRRVPHKCRYYENDFGFTCEREEEQDIDLTQHFDQIEEEASIGKFVADVLLSSSTTEEVLLVEMAVSHRCDEPKISSGLRIIEVIIRNEDDIIGFCKYGFHPNNDFLITYNLKEKPTKDASCNGDCVRNVLLFVIFGSGKVMLLETAPCKAKEPNLRGEIVFSKVLGPTPHYETDSSKRELLRNIIREVHFEGAALRNCYMCRYHGLSTPMEAFCRIDKKEVKINAAIDCEKYRSMRTKMECKRKDAENDAYMRKYGDKIAISRAFRIMTSDSYLY
jgi:Competence protein CoiA-like family